MTTYTQAQMDAAVAQARDAALRESAEKAERWFGTPDADDIARILHAEILDLRAKPAPKPMTIEDVTDHLEDVIGETHDLVVKDRHYAEAIVRYFQQNPAALRVLAGEAE